MSEPLFTCPHCGAQDPDIKDVSDRTGRYSRTSDEGYSFMGDTYTEQEQIYLCGNCNKQLDEDIFDTIEII